MGIASSAVASVVITSCARTIISASPRAGRTPQGTRTPEISSRPKESPTATARKTTGPTNQQRNRSTGPALCLLVRGGDLLPLFLCQTHPQERILLRQARDLLALPRVGDRGLEGQGKKKQEEEGEERHVRVPDSEDARQRLEQLREDPTREHPERQNEPDHRVALLQLPPSDQLQDQHEEEDRRHRGE